MWKRIYGHMCSSKTCVDANVNGLRGELGGKMGGVGEGGVEGVPILPAGTRGEIVL